LSNSLDPNGINTMMIGFANPIAMVEGSILKLTEGATTREAGEQIAKYIGENRISVGYGELDLVGKPHFSKILNEYIATPHIKPIMFNFAPSKGFIPKTVGGLTRTATMEDLARAVS